MLLLLLPARVRRAVRAVLGAGGGKGGSGGRRWRWRGAEAHAQGVYSMYFGVCGVINCGAFGVVDRSVVHTFTYTYIM